MDKPIVIITGGAGFIGSNLAHHLQDKYDYQLAISDFFSEKKQPNLVPLNDFLKIHPDELSDFLEKQSERIKAVFHMGAISATTETNKDLLRKHNVVLSQDLWHFCAEKNIPFIYASSAATYGLGEQGYQDQETLDYLEKLQPLNLYGWSKLEFDIWVQKQLLAEQPKPSQWAGLKFFNVYGPYEEHKESMRSVVSQFYPQILDTQQAKLFQSHNPDYADGEQQRDFIWVKDCVNVVDWLFQNPKVNGLFNLGSGKARSFNDISNALFKELNLEPNITYIPTPENIRQHYQYFTQAEMQKLQNAGYNKAFTSIEEGVMLYVHHLNDIFNEQKRTQLNETN